MFGCIRARRGEGAGSGRRVFARDSRMPRERRPQPRRKESWGQGLGASAGVRPAARAVPTYIAAFRIKAGVPSPETVAPVIYHVTTFRRCPSVRRRAAHTKKSPEGSRGATTAATQFRGPGKEGCPNLDTKPPRAQTST
jgi:hypothetical protein